jgi:hypothetical protein
MARRKWYLKALFIFKFSTSSLRGRGAATDVAISSIALLAEHHVPAVVVPKRVAARRLKNLPSRVIDVYNHRFRLHGNLVLTGEGNA